MMMGSTPASYSLACKVFATALTKRNIVSGTVLPLDTPFQHKTTIPHSNTRQHGRHCSLESYSPDMVALWSSIRCCSDPRYYSLRPSLGLLDLILHHLILPATSAIRKNASRRISRVEDVYIYASHVCGMYPDDNFGLVLLVRTYLNIF